MATINDYYSALDKADAAGDTEAAQYFAGKIKELKGSVAKPTQTASPVQQKEEAGLLSPETLKVPFAGLGTAADTAASLIAGGVAGLFGKEQLQGDIYKGMEERAKQRQEWANPENKEQTFASKLGGLVATLPAQMIMTGAQPLPTATEAVRQGESGENAAKAAIAGTVLGTAANMLPGMAGVGGTVGKKAATGALANIAATAATNKAAQSMMETEAGKKLYETTPEDIALAGVMGAGGGVLHHFASGKTSVKAPEEVATKFDDFLMAKKQAEETPLPELLEKPAEAAPIETEAIDAQIRPIEQPLPEVPSITLEEQAPKIPGTEIEAPLPSIEGLPKSQVGAINPDLLTFGASKLIDTLRDKFPKNGDVKVLQMFKGIFHPEDLTRAVNDTLNPEASRKTVWMKPETFLELAKKRTADYELTSAEKREHLGTVLETEKGWDTPNSIPELELSKDGSTVIGHDGRHRADVLIAKGVDEIPVVLSTRGMLQNKNMPDIPHLIGESGNLVKDAFRPMEHLNQPAARFAEEQPLGLRKPSQGGFFGFKQEPKSETVRQYPSYSSFEKAFSGRADRNTLMEFYKKEGGKLTSQDIAPDPIGNGWQGNNKSDVYADNRTAVKLSEDIPQLGGKLDALMQQRGASLKRSLDNVGATYGINLIDSAKQAAMSATEKVLTPFDSLLTKVKKAGGGWSEIRRSLASFARGEFDPNNPVHAKMKEINDSLYRTVNEAYRRSQEVDGRAPDKIVDLPKEDNYFARMKQGGKIAYVWDESGHRLVDTIVDSSDSDIRKAISFYKRENPRYKVSEIYDNPKGAMSKFDLENGTGISSLFGDIISEPNENVNQGAVFQSHLKERTGSRSWMGNEPWLTEAENAKRAQQAFVRYIESANNYSEAIKAKEQLVQLFKDNPQKLNLISFLQDYIKTSFSGGKFDFAKGIDTAVKSMAKSVEGVFGGGDGTRFINAARQAKRAVGLTTIGLFRTTTSMLQVVQGIVSGHAEVSRATNMLNAKAHLTGMLNGVAAIPFELANSAFAKFGSEKRVKVGHGDFAWMLKQMENDKVTESFLADAVRSHENIGVLGTATTMAEQGAAMGIRVFDQAGRAYAASALFSTFRGMGFSREDAWGRTRDITNVIMGNMMKHNQAPLLRKGGIVGEMTMNMRSFQLNEVNNIAYDIARSFKGDGRAAQALLTKLAITFGLGGLVSTPFIQDIDKLWTALRDAFGTKFGDINIINSPSPTQFLATTYPELWVGPIAQATGVDMSSLGINVWPSSAANAAYALGPAAVKKVVGVKNMAIGQLTGDVGQRLQGTLQFAPDTPFIRDLAERQAAIKLEKGKIAVPSVEGKNQVVRTPEEQELRKWGFTPSEERRKQNLYFQAQGQKTAIEAALKSIKFDQLPEALMRDRINQQHGVKSDYVKQLGEKFIGLGGTPDEWANAIRGTIERRVLSGNPATRGVNINKQSPRNLEEIMNQQKYTK